MLENASISAMTATFKFASQQLVTYTILYLLILYYITLYYIILYYIALYYIVLYNTEYVVARLRRDCGDAQL
jgi:hypothetical protein